VQIVLSTCPQDQAAKLAHSLVSQRLAACVNIIDSIRSVYRWQNQIQDEAEALLIIKTSAERKTELFAALAAEHPYETPEIISLPVDATLPAYLHWVAQETQTHA
jgi:periplasmic divalent cation tolerance protein